MVLRAEVQYIVKSGLEGFDAASEILDRAHPEPEPMSRQEKVQDSR